MQNQVLSMFLDAIMAGLLLTTMVYCLKLNKRIRLLQDSKSELARIIREFDASTTRATQNINEIHAATTRISENIQLKIDKANYLANDLEMMIERGNKMAGKTEPAPVRQAPAAPQRPSTMADIMPARTPEAPRAAEQTAAPAEAGAARPLRMRSRAERELISLLGGKKQNESGE